MVGYLRSTEIVARNFAAIVFGVLVKAWNADYQVARPLVVRESCMPMLFSSSRPGAAFLLFCLGWASTFLQGCASISGGSQNASSTLISISLSPPSASVQIGKSQQF